MRIKKIISFLITLILLFSLNAFAVEFITEEQKSKINLNIFGGVGYSNYLSIKSPDNSDINLNGFNINLLALYSLTETQIGAPIVGLGINYSHLAGYNNFEVNSVEFNEKITMTTISPEIQFGFKFNLGSEVSIFSLVRLGYGAYSKMKFENTSGNSDTNNAVDKELTLGNHFLYGINLIGTYKISEDFDLGVGLTYNRHSFRYNSQTNQVDTSIKTTSFNEYSANLMVSYNL